jgi:hypothetical protein
MQIVFFYKLNVDCVLYPAVPGELTSAHPSLLGATIVMDVFYPSLLSYHCSDALVAMDRLPMATVTYGPLLQCLFVVVLDLQQQNKDIGGSNSRLQHLRRPQALFQPSCQQSSYVVVVLKSHYDRIAPVITADWKHTRTPGNSRTENTHETVFARRTNQLHFLVSFLFFHWSESPCRSHCLQSHGIGFGLL